MIKVTAIAATSIYVLITALNSAIGTVMTASATSAGRLAGL